MNCGGTVLASTVDIGAPCMSIVIGPMDGERDYRRRSDTPPLTYGQQPQQRGGHVIHNSYDPQRRNSSGIRRPASFDMPRLSVGSSNSNESSGNEPVSPAGLQPRRKQRGFLSADGDGDGDGDGDEDDDDGTGPGRRKLSFSHLPVEQRQEYKEGRTLLRLELHRVSIEGLQALVRSVAFKCTDRVRKDDRIVEFRLVAGDPYEHKPRKFDPFKPVVERCSVRVAEQLATCAPSFVYRENMGIMHFASLQLYLPGVGFTSGAGRGAAGSGGGAAGGAAAGATASGFGGAAASSMTGGADAARITSSSERGWRSWPATRS